MNLDFGNRIKSLRLSRSMTQEQLAQKLGVSAQAVSKWESGTNMPDILLLPDLSVIFGVTIDDLFTMTGRTNIFGWIFDMIANEPRILLYGATSEQLSAALTWAFHTHNAYLQCLVMCGIPGVLMAVWFSLRALWAAWRVLPGKYALADKMMAIIPLAMLPNAISEICLFADGMTLYNTVFFFCLGYAVMTAQKNGSNQKERSNA